MSLSDSIAAARVSGPEPQTDGTHAFEYCFNPGDPVFAGHFPGRPVLPGIFQLELTRVAAESVLGCSLAVREISRAKFQRPILPGETINLRLTLSGEKSPIQARAGFSVAGSPAGETLMILCRND